MEKEVLTDIFNLVSSTRQKKLFGLWTTFNPLAENKAYELQKLVDRALDPSAVPANGHPASKKPLLKAQKLFKKYDRTPERALLFTRVKVGFSVFEENKHMISYDPPMYAEYEEGPNPKRPKILKKIQRTLYNGLKPC